MIYVRHSASSKIAFFILLDFLKFIAIIAYTLLLTGSLPTDLAQAWISAIAVHMRRFMLRYKVQI